jgi:hypothetical protein
MAEGSEAAGSVEAGAEAAGSEEAGLGEAALVEEGLVVVDRAEGTAMEEGSCCLEPQKRVM